MSNDSHPNTRSWFVWTTAVAIALFSSGLYVQFFARQPGIDFYHFWGVAAAHSAATEDIGTPYVNAPRYAAILNQRADASDDKHFKSANKQRRTIDPTGTPLFYWSFAWLPKDYTSAHILFRFLQYAAATGAIAWFAIQFGVSAAQAWLFAFISVIILYPFQSDFLVGNINSFQLLACVAFAWLADRLKRAARPILGPIFVSGLVAFVLFKPNLAPISGMLALFAAGALGVRRFAVSVAVAVAFGFALVALSSWYFGTWHAWSEWGDFLRGPNAAKLADYPVSDGNWAASAVFVDRQTNPNYAELSYRISISIGAGLALSWIAAFVIGLRGAKFGSKLAAVARDQNLMLSSAVLFMLAASPLVWFHYCVLAVVPGLWCMFSRPRFGFQAGCGALSLLAYGRLLKDLFDTTVPFNTESTPTVIALAWIPMWIVVLLEVARDRSETKL